MTAPLTPQRNPMVAAVTKLLELADGEVYDDPEQYVLAVLDSLPVEVMEAPAADCEYEACKDGCKRIWLCDSRKRVRAAIAAVRATVVGDE